MVFGLLGKKAEVEVQTDDVAYAAGDTVRARILVRGKDDLKVEEARAELVCHVRYEYRDRDADGDTRTIERTATDERVVRRERIMEAGVIGGDHRDELTVELPIPARAPASGVGEITQVRWEVRAVLNVRWAPDVNGSAPVTVVAKADPGADRWDWPPACDTTDCDLAFELPTRVLAAGERHRGALRLRARAEVEAQEVRVELVRREEVRREEGKTAERVVWAQPVAGARRFAAGEEAEFPFEYGAPSDAYPGHQTEYTTVRWSLRAVVNRRLRDDWNLTQEVVVHNAR